MLCVWNAQGALDVPNLKGSCTTTLTCRVHSVKQRSRCPAMHHVGRCKRMQDSYSEGQRYCCWLQGTRAKELPKGHKHKPLQLSQVNQNTPQTRLCCFLWYITQTKDLTTRERPGNHKTARTQPSRCQTTVTPLHKQQQEAWGASTPQQATHPPKQSHLGSTTAVRYFTTMIRTCKAAKAAQPTMPIPAAHPKQVSSSISLRAQSLTVSPS